MSIQRKLLGRRGEEEAARFLVERGCRILAKNYTCSYGEVDLVVEERETLVFVEVKTRAQRCFGSPSAAVDIRKQRQIAMVAEHYIGEQGLSGRNARFDVVSVEMLPDAEMRIEHIADAFESWL
ncbi:MAG: YraN family protein [Deltaproteobacteria bacterium]|nr:MAG: YraN family protein [Deltaproteobacteria bacterium]PIE73450.1 MAG: YraN family protein [Deltaproteobacteria bacterium]